MKVLTKSNLKTQHGSETPRTPTHPPGIRVPPYAEALPRDTYIRILGVRAFLKKPAYRRVIGTFPIPFSFPHETPVLSLETVRNKTVRFTTLFESVQNSPKQKLSLYNTIPTLDCANKPLKTQSEHNVPDMLYWCVLSCQIVVICYCFVFRTLCLVPRKVFSVLVPVCSLVCGKNKQEM